MVDDGLAAWPVFRRAHNDGSWKIIMMDHCLEAMCGFVNSYAWYCLVVPTNPQQDEQNNGGGSNGHELLTFRKPETWHCDASRFEDSAKCNTNREWTAICIDVNMCIVYGYVYQYTNVYVCICCVKDVKYKR